jgi:hypothetical protein
LHISIKNMHVVIMTNIARAAIIFSLFL